ncbi:hypothetical protein YC2023_121959 [Brassica napus]
MEAVEELIPEVEELIAEVELVEVDMKVLVVKEVVSGHGDVEGLVVVRITISTTRPSVDGYGSGGGKGDSYGMQRWIQQRR